MAELNTLRSRQSCSTQSSSDKTLHKAQRAEIITSHMAMAALRSRSKLSRAALAPPDPGPAHPLISGCAGRQEELELFPMGQGLCFGQLWLKGEAWWDGEPCSSGIDIPQFSVGLAARVSGPLSPWGWSPQGCQGRYLSHAGEMSSRVLTTSLGLHLISSSSSESRLRRAGSVRICSTFL